MSYSTKWDGNPEALTGAPRPLKPGEEHCPYCEGYGYRPRRQDEPSGPKAVRCEYCGGVAVQKRRAW